MTFLLFLFFHIHLSFAAEQTISLTSPVQYIPLEHGQHADYVAQIISGPLSSIENERSLLGLDAKGHPTVPIEKVIVTKPGTPKSDVQKITNEMAKIPSTPVPQKIKMYSPSNMGAFDEPTSNVVFTLIRFLLNGTSIGVTLIYSSGVPVTKAFIVGVLSGAASGALQYKVGLFRDWIRAHTLVRHFGYSPLDLDQGVSEWSRNAFNVSLELTEEFAKFGITEFVYTSLMTATLYLMRTGNLPMSLFANFTRVARVVTQSTFSQGTADIGLFKDVDMQHQYGGWSDANTDFFRNAASFAISALSVAVTAFQLANPGAAEIPLYFFSMPYGFALISVSGLVFYVHGLVTEWANSAAPIHYYPLNFGD